MNKFRPMLAPNDQPILNDIKYPILASFKLDGIRCIFYKGEMLSRSLKQIQNKQLREKFKPIADYSREYNLILDGEIYSPDLTFQEITSMVMTQDFEDKKSIKKYGHVVQIPDHLKFYCFDAVNDDDFEEKFIDRTDIITEVGMHLRNLIQEVAQDHIGSKEEVNTLFEAALENGYEGLILRDMNGKYKCGRGTLKEGLIYKVKPYRTFDAEILDVIQATKVDPNAEKKTNELGRSVTSKKKDDRILIEKASAFLVNYHTPCSNGTEKCENCTCEVNNLKVVIAMTDEEKEEIWKNKEKYIGKMIEYKGMLIGAKDVPRHPVMLRFISPKSK